MAIFRFQLENCYSKKVSKGRLVVVPWAMGYTQIYWQNIPQLLENYTSRFDARSEKVRLTGCGSSNGKSV